MSEILVGKNRIINNQSKNGIEKAFEPSKLEKNQKKIDALINVI